VQQAKASEGENEMTIAYTGLTPASTDLDVFNVVRTHLARQNRKSLEAPDDDGQHKRGCAYRGHDGCACAIGCLILDRFYDPAFEGVSLGEFYDDYDSGLIRLIRRALAESGVPMRQSTIALLKLLQGVHDDYGPRQWPAKLDAIAASLLSA
jgi:hypothetical protein